MKTNELKKIVIKSLEDLKARDILVLEVAELTSIADAIVICSGTSNRHVKSIVDNVVENAKKHQVMVIGVEGEQQGEWALVDLGDIVVHVMLPKSREFYNLEKLWDIKLPKSA